MASLGHFCYVAMTLCCFSSCDGELTAFQVDHPVPGPILNRQMNSASIYFPSAEAGCGGFERSLLHCPLFFGL